MPRVTQQPADTPGGSAHTPGVSAWEGGEIHPPRWELSLPCFYLLPGAPPACNVRGSGSDRGSSPAGNCEKEETGSGAHGPRGRRASCQLGVSRAQWAMHEGLSPSAVCIGSAPTMGSKLGLLVSRSLRQGCSILDLVLLQKESPGVELSQRQNLGIKSSFCLGLKPSAVGLVV